MADNIFTFNELIEEYKIEIPVIQRDYAQGRDNPKAKEIRKIFIAEIKNKLEENNELHLNFIYGKVKDGINNNKKVFIPLDGQQRLTTLFLIHIYLDNANKENLKNFSYKIRPSSKDFCVALADNFSLPENNNYNKLSEHIKDANWFLNYWEKDPTVAGMLRMLDEIHIQFKGNNTYKSKLDNIKFVFIDLDKLEQTDEIYEKMNARGVPLTPFENFKAWLIEEIKNKNTTIRKFENEKEKEWTDLMDIEWTDLFWKNKDDNNMLIDEELMRYFRNMFQILFVLNNKPEQKDKKEEKAKKEYEKTVSILATEKDKISKEYIFLPNSFYTDNNLITEANLNELFSSIYLFEKYDLFINEVFDKDYITDLLFIKDRKSYSVFRRFIDNETTYFDKVMFYALFVFLKTIERKELNDELKQKLKSWIRVIRNLAINTSSNVDNFKNSIRTINRIGKDCLNIYDYLSKEENHDKIKGFDAYQVKEEIKKAELIKENQEWEKLFLKYENHKYFKGQINFLLEISELHNKPINKEIFQDYAEKMAFIFNKKYIDTKNKIKDEFLFERALLYFGDYLVINYGSNNSFGTKEIWRNEYLKNDKIIPLIYKLLKEIKKETIETDLQNCINKLKNEQEKWRTVIIQSPYAIKYCKQSFIRYIDENNILLLKKTRLSGAHSELFTCVFYKEKIEKSSNFEPFKNKRYYYPTDTETPCAYLDNWKYKNNKNIVLDIKTDKKGHFVFSMFDREENDLDNGIVELLRNKGFNENNQNKRFEKILEDLDFDKTMEELEELLKELQKL